jgi:hypothetical protein
MIRIGCSSRIHTPARFVTIAFRKQRSCSCLVPSARVRILTTGRTRLHPGTPCGELGSELPPVPLDVHSAFLHHTCDVESSAMGAHQMFTPYDLRPTIEITAFTLTAFSTFVVMTRYVPRSTSGLTITFEADH